VTGARRAAGQAGQASLEWIGLIGVVSLMLAAIVATATGRIHLGDVARAIIGRLICAVDLTGGCDRDPAVAAASGLELAEVLRAHAPEIRFEHGMTALPVDFRSCRGEGCGNGAPSGAVWDTDSGEPVVAFVHVIDCRSDARAESEARGYECSGRRAGSVYLQYWLYYEDSTSLPLLPGDVGHHEDDWEGYQVRIGPQRTLARATSHKGYNYEGGPQSWLSDAGITNPARWGAVTGHLYVSGGSHAGHAHEPWDTLRHSDGARARRATFGGAPHRVRWTPASRLELVPIESLDRATLRTRFAVDPPWRKPSYRDPEA
jgi:hypothetical protein